MHDVCVCSLQFLSSMLQYKQFVRDSVDNSNSLQLKGNPAWNVLALYQPHTIAYLRNSYSGNDTSA
jgi:hypothetical protein